MKFFFFFFKYNIIKKIIKNNKYFNNNIYIYHDKININESFKILKLFFKRGLLLKIINLFCLYFFNFYSNFSFYNKLKNLDENFFFYKYKYFNEIKNLINNNTFFLNPIFLFNWYYFYFNFLIFIKFSFNSPLKLKKKKINKKYIIQFLFLKKNNRIKYFLKWLKQLFLLNYKKNMKKSFFNLFNDIFLNFKYSQLYKYKISLYNYFLINK